MAKRQTGSEIIKALEAVYAEIRKNHPELPDAVIITGSGLSGGGGKWAHFWADRWVDRDGSGKRPEIFVAGERLACGAELTVQTMLHECTHALAAVRGEKDTSRQNRYHNRTFVKIAEEMGLEYRRERPDPVIGFSAVELTDEAREKYRDVIKGLDEAIRTYLDDPLLPMFIGGATGSGDGGDSGDDGAHRIGPARRRTAGATSGSRNNTKYVCDCPEPRIIRVAPKTFDKAPIICGECGSDFHPED